jgi:DNA-3-methyladenine glycosylase II
VVSWTDCGISQGMMRLYGLETLTREHFEKYRKRYSPYGSVASPYLWRLPPDP